MARFLNLVFNCRHELTDPAAVVEVEAVCADLSTRSDFLDATTTESLILGPFRHSLHMFSLIFFPLSRRSKSFQ